MTLSRLERRLTIRSVIRQGIRQAQLLELSKPDDVAHCIMAALDDSKLLKLAAPRGGWNAYRVSQTFIDNMGPGCAVVQPRRA